VVVNLLQAEMEGMSLLVLTHRFVIKDTMFVVCQLLIQGLKLPQLHPQLRPLNAPT